MAKAYLGLGANVPPAEQRMRAAENALNGHEVEIVARSSLYRTEPWGGVDQPWYLNRVLAVATEHTPRELLAVCKSVERSLGREDHGRWGPREIDVDVLMYEAEVIEEDGLVLPHPRLAERRFVLVPLSEIASEVVHPVYGKSVRALLDALDDARRVERIAER